MTTPWECIETSTATARVLDLGQNVVWSRMLDGVARFLVLPDGIDPNPNSPGWFDLNVALRNRA